MNWKTKARIQNIVSLLPSDFSYEMYYQLQRRFGGYRKVDPFNKISRLIAGAEYSKNLQQFGVDFKGKTIFEVGTGRNILMPISFWLMGAEKIYTIDLNPYLKWELVKEGIIAIANNQDKLKSVLGDMAITDRVEALIKFAKRQDSTMKEFLELCRVAYLAPGDASDSKLPDNSIDYHISYTVYEHIPEEVLVAIVKEGNRIIKPCGYFLNTIDFSDHFEQMDKNISRINFLQYTNEEWDKYADNRYMYMNRLRFDDYERIFLQAGHEILSVEKFYNDRSTALLESGTFHLDSRFKNRPMEVLKVIEATFISKIQK